MTPMTEEEWERVQEALCAGGLRECVDNLLTSRVSLNPDNRQMIEQAYDDGCGGGIALVGSSDPPWFVGMYEDSELCQGVENDGVLYTIVHASGGGLVSVLVGRDLVENEVGFVFSTVAEAKAYILGRIAQ